MNNWYVYRHIRIDKNEPFYIGIGNKNNHARAYENHCSKRNKIWNDIVLKSSYEVEILFDGLTKSQAAEKESEFIYLYGRIDLKTGSLCNMTDGGDGIWNCIRSNETRQKLREQKLGDKNHRFGIKQTYETLVKRGVFESKKKSEETKKKQSLASIKSGQAKKTEIINCDTNESLGVYHSISEALRSVGLNPVKYSGKASLIARGLGGRKKLKGYSFKYLA
jgi:hypothetical protein